LRTDASNRLFEFRSIIEGARAEDRFSTEDNLGFSFTFPMIPSKTAVAEGAGLLSLADLDPGAGNRNLDAPHRMEQAVFWPAFHQT